VTLAIQNSVFEELPKLGITAAGVLRASIVAAAAPIKLIASLRVDSTEVLPISVVGSMS
jgi:hypothetical protein